MMKYLCFRGRKVGDVVGVVLAELAHLLRKASKGNILKAGYYKKFSSYDVVILSTRLGII